MRPRLDRVAVSTSDDALSDLSTGLCKTFRVADIQRLAYLDVVEVKSGRMGPEATINAPALQLVSIKPTADGCCALSSFRIDPLTIFSVGQSGLSPDLRLSGVVCALPWLPVRGPNLVRVAFSPALCRCAPMFDSF